MSDPVVTPIEEEPNSVASGKNYLHYDPDRVDYAISDQELGDLELCSDNLWKDICLVSAGIGIPTLLNAISIANASLPTGQAKFVPNVPFTLNLILGIVGIAFAIGFGIAWWKTRKRAKQVIERIREKPKIPLN